jgi:hypothetical protein
LLEGTILFCLLLNLFHDGHGVEIMEWTLLPTAPKGLEAEGQDLYAWVESLGASAAKCRHIVGLLNVCWLCSLPLPRNMYKVAGIAECTLASISVQAARQGHSVLDDEVEGGRPRGIF